LGEEVRQGPACRLGIEVRGLVLSPDDLVRGLCLGEHHDDNAHASVAQALFVLGSFQVGPDALAHAIEVRRVGPLLRGAW